MTRANGAAAHRLAQAILWIFALVTPLYWIVFFATGNLTPSPTDCGLKFELAFPAADLWLAIASALGAIGLARNRRWGRLMAVAAAGAILYLGLMDTTFDIENGVYLTARPQVAVEAIINVACFAAAAYLFYALLGRESD